MYLEQDFAEFANSRLRGFVGREWLVRLVQAWVSDRKGPRFLVLVGEPGIGKSAFVAHLWQVHKLPHAVHFCIGGRGGTIEPLSFVKSIAEQLAKQLSTFAEALIETQELFADQNITITSSVQTGNVQAGGQVTGVELHLHNLSPEQAFDRMLRHPLSHLSKNQLLTPVLIVVDALDEALTYGNIEHSIVGLLAQANDLPGEVHFFLTTRPDSRILDALHGFPHLLVDANSQDNRADIVNYLRQCWDTDGQLRDALGRWGWNKFRSIKQLENASEGNFLYLRQVLPLIATGQVTTSEALPNGLNEVYLYLLRTRIGSDRWKQWGAALLEIVLALQEPANLEQISTFLGWPTRETYDRLQLLAQLFDPVLFEQERYWRHHWSIVEFLRNRQLSRPYWCDLTQGHSHVANYYLENWGGLAAGLPGLYEIENLKMESLYGLSYLGAHLLAAGRQSELHSLMLLDYSYDRSGSASSRSYNLWYWVHEQIGDFSGYLADLDRARNATEQTLSEQDLPTGAALLWRYTMVHSSLVSLQDAVPATLIAALVEKHLWKSEQALMRIRTISDSEQKTVALREIVKVLSPSQVRDAYEIAKAIASDRWRATALGDLIPYLPEENKLGATEHAWSAATNLEEPRDFLPVIYRLVPTLPIDRFADVLEKIRKTEIDYVRRDTVAVLGRIVTILPSSDGQEILSEAESIASEAGDYGEALAILAFELDRAPTYSLRNLAKARAHKAWDTYLDRGRAPTGYISGGAQIGIYMDRRSAITVLVETTAGLLNDVHLKEALNRCLILPPYSRDFDNTLRKPRDTINWLSHLLPFLNEADRSKALECIYQASDALWEQGDVSWKYQPLIPVIDWIDEERRGEIVSTVGDLAQEGTVDLASVLTCLPLLSETAQRNVLESMLARYQAINDGDSRCLAYAHFASFLPLEDRTIAIHYALVAARAFLHLTKNQSEYYDKIWTALFIIIKFATKHIFPSIAEVLERLLSDGEIRGYYPNVLASCCSEEVLWETFLIFRDRRKHEWTFLLGAASQIPAEKLAVALEETAKMKDSATQKTFLELLIPRLPRDLVERVTEIARNINNPPDQLQVLLAVRKRLDAL